MIQYSRERDLSKRTADFGKVVIKFCQPIKQDAITKPLISQLIRAATSIGANYAEANGASSRKDFINKIYIARKEAQETYHWLETFDALVLPNRQALDDIKNECHELILIFQKIRNTIKEKRYSFDY